MRSGAATGLTGMPQRPAQINDAVPKIAPKWLKHDRQVSLSFVFAVGFSASGALNPALVNI